MKLTKLFVCTVLVMATGLPQWGQISPAINTRPSRAFGHARLIVGPQTTAPNLLEGREFSGPTAIAFDTTSSPPILYVADSLNNRVLAWRNPANLLGGERADKVIGQRDFFTALQGGPGSATGGLTAAGLALPNSVAVDSGGNLWVIDAGNNRILRFPRPLEQQGDFVAPDLVVGQKTVATGNLSNQGQSQPSSRTLSFNRGGSTIRAGLAFDAQGNLWVADAYNNRVLRYPAASLNTNEPAADVVLGQGSFNTETAPTGGQNDLVNLLRPASVAVDSNGGVWVTDQLLRVVYYDVPVSSGNPRRVLGIQPVPGQGEPPRPPAPNDYTLGQLVQGANLQVGVPQCVFLMGTVPFVCDNVANRIVRFDGPAAWPAATNNALSPQIKSVYGQDTAFGGGVNRGQGASKPQSNTFSAPAGGAFYNNEMWIADTGNHRVVVIPQSAGDFNFGSATRLVGQISFDVNAPNLVDGRELYVISNFYRGTGVIVDRNSTPNHVYVADSLNNRVLGFRDVRAVGTDSRTLLTQPADIVIGQPDLFHSIANFPSGDPLAPSDQGLLTPSGVAVDAQGNLWVADTGNGRLVRFPAPFEQPAGTQHRATVVLGQANFSIKITDASSSTMAAPVGVAVFNNGDIAASDLLHHRVLLFRRQGADFVNGQTARAVLGQQTFSGSTAGAGVANLNTPRGLAVDTGDRLYVADAGNSRVLVYSSTGTINNGASGTSIPNIGGPEGVAVSRATGEIWISSLNTNRVLRYREFTQLGQNPTATAEVGSTGPLALALDEFDNLIVVDAANRITFYYAQLVYRHAATSASGANQIATMTPNLYTYVGRLGKDFELTPAQGSIPYPKELSGIQVLVEGIPAPITAVTNNLIYFLVPNNAPTSGEAEYLITRPATGEILAAGTFLMGPAAPGFFTANQQGTRQVAAIHFPDGSTNSSSNAIGQDQILILALTGYGRLENAPPDGEAPTGPVPINKSLRIIIGGTYTVPADKILYSGLSTIFPGLWQINIRTPRNGEPGAPLPANNVPIIVFLDDVPSNIGGTGNLGVDQLLTVPNGLVTTVALK